MSGQLCDASEGVCLSVLSLYSVNCNHNEQLQKFSISIRGHLRDTTGVFVGVSVTVLSLYSVNCTTTTSSQY